MVLLWLSFISIGFKTLGIETLGIETLEITETTETTATETTETATIENITPCRLSNALAQYHSGKSLENRRGLETILPQFQ